MPTYRPSCRARIQIRLEEGAQPSSSLAGVLPKAPPTGAALNVIEESLGLGKNAQASRIQRQRRALRRSRALLSPDNLLSALGQLDNALDKLQLGGEDQKRPAALEGGKKDDLIVIGGVQPSFSRISRHGLKDAAECQVKIDFRSLPIDPRSVRSAFVELVIGVVDADDFEEGVLFGGKRDDGTLLSVVGRDGGQDVRFGSSTRFVGFVDEWSVDTGENGDEVTLDSRDVSALLRDQEMPTGLAIDMQLPLADGIEKLLNEFKTTAGMQVQFGQPGPVPAFLADRGPVPADFLGQAQKARRGTVARRSRSAGTKMSAWDHIMDTVVAVGYVPVVRGYELQIINPRTFFADESEARRMVYGRNVKHMQFSRKLGGVQVPTVEVRVADPTIGRTRWARAPVPKGDRASGIFGKTDPPRSTRVSKVTPAGVVDDRIQVFNVSGIYSAKQLERTARAIFEQIGRQEVEGEFETDDVTSFEGDEGDLLHLQAGDALDMLIAPLNDASSQDATNNSSGGSPSSLQELQSMSVARRAAYLQGLGWRPQDAQKLAAAQEQSGMITTFRVQDVDITWDSDQGIKIGGDFVNFLVLREAPDSAEQQPSATASALTKGRATAAASALRDASKAGQTLGSQAAAGEVTPTEYATGGTAAAGKQNRAAGTYRRTG